MDKMKIGPEHVTSNEKRCFDMFFSSLLLPSKKMGEVAVSQLIKRTTKLDLPSIFEQVRMGRNHKPFSIQKFTTIYPGTETSLGKWAVILRRLGGDELPQVVNIRAGEMSFIGPRPLLVPEYEEIRDNLDPTLGKRWDAVLEQSRPGLYGSWGLLSHYGHSSDLDAPQQRAENDIQDFVDASFARDATITADLIGLLLKNNLK